MGKNVSNIEIVFQVLVTNVNMVLFFLSILALCEIGEGSTITPTFQMNPLGLREKCMWHRGSSKYLIPTCDIKDFQKFLVISEPAFWIIWVFSSSPLVHPVFKALCWLLFFFHSFTHSFIKSILVTYLQYAHHYWPVLCPKSPLAFRNMTHLLFIQTLPKISYFLFFASTLLSKETVFEKWN